MTTGQFMKQKKKFWKSFAKQINCRMKKQKLEPPRNVFSSNTEASFQCCNKSSLWRQCSTILFHRREHITIETLIMTKSKQVRIYSLYLNDSMHLLELKKHNSANRKANALLSIQRSWKHPAMIRGTLLYRKQSEYIAYKWN